MTFSCSVCDHLKAKFFKHESRVIKSNRHLSHIPPTGLGSCRVYLNILTEKWTSHEHELLSTHTYCSCFGSSLGCVFMGNIRWQLWICLSLQVFLLANPFFLFCWHYFCFFFFLQIPFLSCSNYKLFHLISRFPVLRPHIISVLPVLIYKIHFNLTIVVAIIDEMEIQARLHLILEKVCRAWHNGVILKRKSIFSTWFFKFWYTVYLHYYPDFHVKTV